MITFKPCTPGFFGDLWLFASYALSMSEERGEVIGLAVDDTQWKTIKDMAQAMEESGQLCRVDEGQPLRIADTRRLPVKKTRVQWRESMDVSLDIAYRFDSFYSEKKSAPHEHEALFHSEMQERGFNPPTKLHRDSYADSPINEAINILSESRYCVLVNTGISQLAYSVGCPVHSLCYAASLHHVDEWDAQAAGRYQDVLEFLEATK